MNKNIPKITIATVTYNAEEFLERTIKSVINQDYKNIEYIIIDGRSTDSTLKIVEKYTDHISYFISEHDNGIYDAMNKAIDIATGEWINFMNAGDSFCEKNTLSKVFSLKLKEVDIIGGDCFHITNEERIYKTSPKTTNVFNGTFCCHQSLITKTSLMKKFKFDTRFKIVADYDFMLKAYIQKSKFYFVDFAISNYLGGGFYESNRFIAAIEQLYIISQYIKNPIDIFQTNIMKLIENQKYVEYNYNAIEFSKLYRLFNNTLEHMNLKDKKFILYGYGTIGKLVYTIYKESIIEVVDKDFKKISLKENLDIIEIDSLKNYNNELILISVLGKEKEIKKELLEKYSFNINNILEIKL